MLHIPTRLPLFAACMLLASLYVAGCGKNDSGDKPSPADSTAAADTAAHPANSGYAAVNVPNGGSVSGRVVWAGKQPEMPQFDITSDANACATATRNNRLEIGKDGGIRWAVVYIEEMKQGKAMPAFPPESLLVDQHGCQYTPHVLVAPVGTLVTFLNSDDIAHNVRVEHEKSDSLLLNRTQPGRGKSDRMLVDRPGPASVGCDYHPWMNAYVFGVTNPYFAVTGADGSFTIDGLPPGTYTVKLWLNGFKTTPKRDNQGRTVGYAFGADYSDEKSVDIAAGAKADLKFEVKL